MDKTHLTHQSLSGSGCPDHPTHIHQHWCTMHIAVLTIVFFRFVVLWCCAKNFNITAVYCRQLQQLFSAIINACMEVLLLIISY